MLDSDDLDQLRAAYAGWLATQSPGWIIDQRLQTFIRWQGA